MQLGFRVDTISPADDPTIASVSGFGTRFRLVRDASRPGGTLRLTCRDPARLTNDLDAGGLSIELVAEDSPLALPPLRSSFVVTRNDPVAWHLGRAGMEYRDLIPDRLGGRFIASHVRIRAGGEVPDYVHFHAIRFQMIYCVQGWVRLVYEDQGAPFVMRAGDCVVQPPKIRHRVLECSPGLEVIEIGTPAVHATHADHVMSLPTHDVRVEREFSGQRFHWHRADEPLVARSLGIGDATRGTAAARVVGGAEHGERIHDAELLFGFVLRGAMTLQSESQTERVTAADAFVLPPERSFALHDATADLAWLEVTLPAAVTYQRCEK